VSSKNFKKGFFNELAKLAAQLADHHALPDVAHNFDDFSITKQRTASGYNAGLTFHDRRPIIHVLDKAGRGNWFYQSQYGTGGKPRGLWYPVGGVVASGPNLHDDGWIIKGNVDTDPGYGRPDLARLGDAVNRRMPKDPGELSAFFKRLSGDKDRLTPEELINSPAFQKRIYAHTPDGSHPYDHSAWFLQDWKNRHLTPVWGSRKIQPTIAHTKLGFFNELRKLAADKVPHGVLAHRNKLYVGVNHGRPVEIADRRLVDRIKRHGKNFGYFLEGPRDSVTAVDHAQPLFNLKGVDDYAGSWDDDRMRRLKSVGLKAHNFSPLATNVDVNWSSIGQKMIDPNKSILDSLTGMSNQAPWFKSVGLPVTRDHLTDYLTQASEGVKNNENFAQWAASKKATPRNVRKFLTTLERYSWPDNWNTDKYESGAHRLAMMETRERDAHTIDHMGPGVYFAGSGHLKSIADELTRRKLKYKLMGGSEIG